MLCGHLDKMVVFNDEIFGADHKTTNRPLTDYEPNRFGPAVVWPYHAGDGTTQIRCFIPGAGT